MKHPGAVVIIPFLSKDKIILIWQYRPVIGKYIYELPAGTIEKGENVKKCAERELIEETAYRSKKINFLRNIYPVPGYSTEILKIFIAKNLEKVKSEEQNFMPDEVINVKIFTKPQIKKLFKSGQIIDAKTISGLAIVGWL